MVNIDKRILEFIQDHHVLTLATSNNNQPYCANCFYVYLEEENCLIFTSDLETKHVQDILQQNYVAGSIVLETSVVGRIQGVQFNGIISRPEGEFAKKVKDIYETLSYGATYENYFVDCES